MADERSVSRKKTSPKKPRSRKWTGVLPGIECGPSGAAPGLELVRAAQAVHAHNKGRECSRLCVDDSHDDLDRAVQVLPGTTLSGWSVSWSPGARLVEARGEVIVQSEQGVRLWGHATLYIDDTGRLVYVVVSTPQDEALFSTSINAGVRARLA